MSEETYILDDQVITWDRAKLLGLPFNSRTGSVREDVRDDAWVTRDGFDRFELVFSIGKGESVSLEWRHEIRMYLNWEYAGHRILMAKVMGAK